MSTKSAISFGFTGIQLRSTGICWDLRKVSSYECYSKLNFEIPYGLNGDCYDRYLLRIEELYQSVHLIKQSINKIPSGIIKVENYKIVPPHRQGLKKSMEALIHHFKLYSSGFIIPKSEAYIGIEAPKGEFGVYLMSNNSEIPYRYKIRVPGFMHLQGINYMAKSHLIADVVTIIGSLDIVFGEIDR